MGGGLVDGDTSSSFSSAGPALCDALVGGRELLGETDLESGGMPRVEAFRLAVSKVDPAKESCSERME